MGAPSGPSLPPAPGTPAWLTPVVQITTQFGVPTVFAAVLLYFVLFKVGGVLTDIEKWEEDRTRILSAMQDTIVATLERQTTIFDKAIRDNIAANKELYERLDRNIERNMQPSPRRPRPVE